MKKIIVFIIMSLLAVGLYAANTYQVTSLIEGTLNLHVKPGQTVKKGQLLFNMDPTPFVIAKQKAANEIKYYQHLFKINKKLITSRAVSKSDYQKALYDYNKAITDYKTADLQIKNCYYYAPFNAKITKVVYANGSGVGDGNEVVDVQKV